MRYPLAQMQAHATALLRAFEAAGAPSEALRATSFQSASWPGGAGAPVGEQAALALSARIYTPLDGAAAQHRECTCACPV